MRSMVVIIIDSQLIFSLVYIEMIDEPTSFILVDFVMIDGVSLSQCIDEYHTHAQKI